MITTHLILVSEQPIPNVTPILDERLKPKKVVMLVSEKMTARSKALENIFKPRGIQVEIIKLPDAYDPLGISEIVLEILVQYPNQDIALNATGGTKLMSIAATEAFSSAKYPIFYVHPEKDLLLWLSPKQAPIDLADRLKLADYLKAYGASSVSIPDRHGVTHEIKQLTQDILINFEKYANELASLNYLAYTANNHKLAVQLNNEVLQNQQLLKLINQFTEAGLCKVLDKTLYFTDEEARNIVNGGWLEQYVYSACLSLKKELGIQDIARNITIVRSPDGKNELRNEIDIGFIKDNRLYLIECKTKRYDKGESAELLYKMDSLRDLIGGLQGKALLVSYNPLDNSSNIRAKELKIKLCCKTELLHLKQHIKNWITER